MTAMLPARTRWTRFAPWVAVVALPACIPLPIHSARVEPGLSVTVAGGVRMIADSAGARRAKQEVGVAPSVGFARADGSGPALRGGVAFSPSTGRTFDLYGQAPRILNALTVGGGLMFDIGRRYAPHTSPYYAAAFDLGRDRMLYGAQSFTRRGVRDSTRESGSVVLLGYQWMPPTVLHPLTTRRVTYRAFAARVASMDPFTTRWPVPPAKSRSIFFLGVSTDLHLPRRIGRE